jgi:hypothetical protein
MRILYLADLNGYSHDKKWITYLASQAGVYCYVICTRNNHKRLTKENILDLQAHNIELLDSIDYFSLRRFYRTYRSLKYLTKVIKKYQIDLLHIMYIDPNGLWGVFKKRLGCPLIMTTRGSDVHVGLKNVIARHGIINRILFQLYKLAFSSADAITSTSGDQLLKLQQEFAIDTTQLVVRTGATYVELTAEKSDPGYFGLNHKKYVFFPRSMRPIYNHELAIEAVGQLPAEIRSSFDFVFINRDSEDQDYVDKIIQLMDDIPDIRWKFLSTRTHTEMAALYQHSSLVVMTPLSDGSPVSAMEAMMYRTPVIMPPLKYDKDLFGEGIFLLSSWDPRELAQLIIDILSGKLAVQDKIEIAYRTVMEKGNFPVEMGKVIGLYHSLLKK